jgi:very-short-patch-repair endonuclease
VINAGKWPPPPPAGENERGAFNPPPQAGEEPSVARRRGPSRPGEARSLKFAKKKRTEMTKAEVIIWQHLRGNALLGLRVRRQHPIGPFIVDFAFAQAKLVVEVDGVTHATDEERAYDVRRRAYLNERGWHEIRVANEDVYTNLDGVLEAVWREVSARTAPSGTRLRREPPPPPAGADEGGR